ncbi:hypothetical protein [Flammeovirga agarivorans]|uniref:Oligosaccharide repeat unit polymerase n=1 Tax=Flammeovirga agarivorans TaxID=2726742 RepID=A0A7X8XUW8_9BACT|nr:hypothetical protein [Flammeovirga agarivorans]NLR90500.1 hypothetical protein [Flammeovirga agarivorans]
MTFWTYIGIIFTLYIIWKFIDELGKSIPILELLCLLMCLQWIIGPYNSYNSNISHYKYYMYVDETTYMSFVVPCVIIFTTILLYNRKKISITINPTSYLNYAYRLLLIGIISDLLKIISPPSLYFFLFLTSQTKFISAIILISSKKVRDKYIFIGIIFYLISHALTTALFHDLIIWAVFIFMYWCIYHNTNFKIKTLLITFGIISIISIQFIKSTYRSFVWNNYSGNKIELFLQILYTNDVSYYQDKENLNNLNIRLNQGWIISSIMKNVPQNTPFAEGETITNAISSAILPRFINPNKKKAGGQENFIKYTGLSLGKGTSMGLSIIGEFYANFGKIGSLICMIIWGYFLSLIWNRLYYSIFKKQILLFFLPLIFLQVIKAETELVVVLNHLLKSLFVVYLLIKIQTTIK